MMRRLIGPLMGALLLAGLGCPGPMDTTGPGDGDAGPGPGPDGLPTFSEPVVQSADVEGLAVVHSRVEQEVFYEEGTFAEHHPIAFIIQMAWDADGFTHPLYAGLVNKDRTRACVVGEREVAYGGPGTVADDVQARTFVIQTYLPDFCGPAFMGEGPYDVWVGANRYVAANPAVVEDDEEVAEGQDLAFLEEGNVLVFGDAGVTDLSGASRDGCGALVAGAGQYDRTDDACGVEIQVVESPGANLLVDRMVLDSSVAVLTTTTLPNGPTVCVQDKGEAFLRGTVALALYGDEPADAELDEAGNDLEVPVRVIQRVCADGGGMPGDTRCDRGESDWIPLLINPEAESERDGWDDAAVAAAFPEAPPGPMPVDGEALEMGGFDDTIADMAFHDLREAPQQLLLPREACMPVQMALANDQPGFVLETCIDTGGSEQDTAFGGTDDNCIRQRIEVVEQQVTTEVDPDMPPPPPPGEGPGPGNKSNDHSGGWLAFQNREGSWGTSYGDSDWAKLAFEVGYKVAAGSEGDGGAYAGAWLALDLTGGKYNFELLGLEVYGDAHDSSSDEGSEAAFEATRFGISEGLNTSTDAAFELRLSVFGGTQENCVDKSYGWWVVSIDIEGCASFTADIGGTIEGAFDLENDDGNIEAAVGLVDVGGLVDATMDGSLEAGDGCCSVKVSGALEPLVYLSFGHDYYLIGEVEPDGDLVGITIAIALGDFDVEIIDGYVKLKVKFAGFKKSTKLINKDGWEWGFTLFGFSISF